jgi:hypothetical protein
MTQQQIIDAGINYTMSTRPICMGGTAFEERIRQYNRNPLFEVGATWAKENLIKEACEWLKNNITDDVLLNCGSVIKVITVDELTKEFRKAMEE